MEWLKKFIAIVLFVLLCVFLVIQLIKENERTSKFKKVLLTNDNKIINRTDKTYLDTILNVGLRKLKIKDINIIIYPLSKNAKHVLGNDLELKAYVVNNNKQYIIWIDNMSRVETIGTLAHEMIHIRQYYDDKLVVHEDAVFWLDEPYDLNKMDYRTRPWEIDAFEKQEKFRQELMKDLFN